MPPILVLFSLRSVDFCASRILAYLYKTIAMQQVLCTKGGQFEFGGHELDFGTDYVELVPKSRSFLPNDSLDKWP